MDKQHNHEEMVKEAVEEAKQKAAEESEEVADENPEAAKPEEDQEVSKTEDVQETAEEPAEGGRFFKKKKDKKDQKIEELTDKLTRQMAEFDNFRKRTEKEKSMMYEMGAKDVVEKILPIIDNFERGFAGVQDEQRNDPFVDGMDKIYKQLITALDEMGVKPIEAIGQKFDPELHNAVMHEESEEHDDNTVAEEFLKGYTYRDSVVRHSMVKVVN